MAKILRVLTDPDFTTKGSPLTKEEADQDLIDIWDATLDGKGVTATATELNRLDGDLATVRSNLGLSIGSDVQAWDADLDTYASNPLTASELGQLQNIDTTTISATQWGYVGALDQGLATTDSVTHAAGTFTGDVLIESTQPTFTLNDTDTAATSFKVDVFGNFVDMVPAGLSAQRLQYDPNNSFWRFHSALQVDQLLTAGNSAQIRGDGNFPSTGEGLEIVYVQNRNYQQNTGDGVSTVQSYDRDNSLWRDIDLRGNDIRIKPEGSNGVLVDGLLTAPTIETDVLRTTLFKPSIVSGMGGESVYNSVSQVEALPSTDVVEAEDAVFSAGDWVVISSGNFNSKGFSSVKVQIASVNADGVTLNLDSATYKSGAYSDISTGDTVIKMDGNMIYVDARDSTTNGPRLEGYQNIANYSESPLGDGTKDFSWAITPNYIFYDAMGGSISNKIIEAPFGNNDIGAINNDSWNASVSESGINQSSNIITPVGGKYRHRFGINNLVLSGYAKKVLNINTGSWSSDHEIRFSIWDQQGVTKLKEVALTANNISSSYSSFAVTLSLDSLNLTSGQDYFIQADVYVFINGADTNAADDTAVAETYLREDYNIDRTT